jgi:Zn-dependent peptidase ImmA (M78 family)/DNA-binding XRE family transcriptional regulator
MGKRGSPGIPLAGEAAEDSVKVPSSTPGFVGERLREARQVRGLRAVELAEILDISPQAISSYEKGQKSPSPAIADALAEKLNMPPHFFTRPVSQRHDRPVFYRSMSSATKKARARADGRLGWLEELTEYMAGSVDFPPVNLPVFDVPADPLLLADEDIERMAEDARKFWKMSDGPIGNMVYLLENQGVIVARDNLGDVTLDSLSTFSDLPYVMIGTEKGTAVRWRYDAAHELGHLLLHRNLNPKALTRAVDFRRVEKQAHRFGAAFLLPMDAFADDFFSASLDTLRAMKPHWRVSIAMMIMRARDGGLISEEHERRMFINYYRRSWRRSEPLDDKLEAEKPRLLHNAVDLILSHGAQSAAEFAAAVALAANDIESLCGLQHGFLRSADEPTVSLRAKPAEATIYKFPSHARHGG